MHSVVDEPCGQRYGRLVELQILDEVTAAPDDVQKLLGIAERFIAEVAPKLSVPLRADAV